MKVYGVACEAVTDEGVGLVVYYIKSRLSKMAGLTYVSN